MKTFKTIDFGIQVLIMVAGATVACIDLFNGIVLFLLALLAWNILSLFVHVFFPISKRFSWERVGVYLHTTLIVAVPFLDVWHKIPFGAYLVYAAGLAVYYLILCYRELRYINDLRDQMRLSDVQHH